jgi:hypothetical protein
MLWMAVGWFAAHLLSHTSPSLVVLFDLKRTGLLAVWPIALADAQPLMCICPFLFLFLL